MADTEKIIRKKYDVPIWHKSNLTIDEAVEYSGIPQHNERVVRQGHQQQDKVHLSVPYERW
ncbi:excisionase [Dorea sp. OM07-5]|uniref:excisionase n=1 Tax=Dorea sp. OM07-5 TaxID=2293100 RepID=UPI001FAAA5AA|nr:excisionase [Dorea sp. OM07-5]